MQLKAYKSAHKGVHALQIELDTTPPKVKLHMVQSGDTFLREGAVCMRLKDDAFDGQGRDRIRNDNKVMIINLQTANAWLADGEDEIFMIDAKLVITKVYKLEF